MTLDLHDLSPQGVVPLGDVALRLHERDNVAVATVALRQETTLALPDSVTGAGGGVNQIPVRDFIPAGHKVALAAIPDGAAVRRYGQIIGFADGAIAPGAHVHTHNVTLGTFERDYAIGAEAQPVEIVPEAERQTFMGYARANGRAGTRNLIAVIGTVNCSAHTCRAIAHHFTPERLAAYPNVDGVIALTHTSGCAMAPDTLEYIYLQRTLAGMAHHPNVAGAVLVGLGCENNQVTELAGNYGLDGVPLLAIQDLGGIRKTVAAGIEAVERLLDSANAIPRTPQPVSELALALQCGGSDAWSGVTANPLVGQVVDLLVQQGGSAVLAETPEIYGAEPVLTRRAIRQEVGRRVIDKVRWWEEFSARQGFTINNNPSTGNKAGGLTTIYEKSLGAVAKGGSTPLEAVYDYAAPITARGLGFMDSPGYDPVGVTGQVAGGCNLVLFTTGRGSVFGFMPAPVIKISTNTATYERMTDDMDFDAGAILDGLPMEDAAAALLDLVIRVASGEASKSEAQGVGEAEFVPWLPGGPL